MRKSIFRKILTYNITVVLLSIVLTGALLYTQLGYYFRQSVYNSLQSRAAEVAKMAEYIMDSVNDAVEQAFIKQMVGFAGNEGGQGIIVTDRKSGVIAVSGFEEGQINSNQLSYNSVARALYGESFSGEGNLDGFLNKKLLYTVVPLNTNRGVEGAVIVCSTRVTVRTMQIDIMMRFLWVVMFVIILSLTVSAFLSDRLARPIREITVGAQKIASGDFSHRVKVEPEGEMHVLTKTFNQMSESLEEMDEIQSSFISNVSHELRTPMTIISGFVEGVLDGTIPEEEHKKYLGIVLQEIKRLNRLVNDLLEMSRLNSGKIELKMTPFDINESVRKAIIAFEQGLSDKKIDVTVDFENDPMLVMGNSDSVYRVISNLLDNAVKFTPEEGYVKISVCDEGLKTKITIENSGKGLSEKELKHIWDRFYQTDKSRGSKNSGVGLGLYIVKNIMHSHNNQIYAESKEGEWTRFIFELDSVKNK
ncbi:MAG: ATP-binding protein [Clostridia bacterium]